MFQHSKKIKGVTGNREEMGYEGVHWIDVAYDEIMEVGFAYLKKLHLL
jgi:hypothetical protein